MCRHCRHPELRDDFKLIKESLIRYFDPVAKFKGDRKAALKKASRALHVLKRARSQLRRSGRSTIKADYTYDLLRFCAFVLNQRGWDNGGNYFVG